MFVFVNDLVNNIFMWNYVRFTLNIKDLVSNTQFASFLGHNIFDITGKADIIGIACYIRDVSFNFNFKFLCDVGDNSDNTVQPKVIISFGVIKNCDIFTTGGIFRW